MADMYAQWAQELGKVLFIESPETLEQRLAQLFRQAHLQGKREAQGQVAVAEPGLQAVEKNFVNVKYLYFRIASDDGGLDVSFRMDRGTDFNFSFPIRDDANGSFFNLPAVLDPKLGEYLLEFQKGLRNRTPEDAFEPPWSEDFLGLPDPDNVTPDEPTYD